MGIPCCAKVRQECRGGFVGDVESLALACFGHDQRASCSVSPFFAILETWRWIFALLGRRLVILPYNAKLTLIEVLSARPSIHRRLARRQQTLTSGLYNRRARQLPSLSRYNLQVLCRCCENLEMLRLLCCAGASPQSAALVVKQFSILHGWPYKYARRGESNNSW
jgi:hypothetical protein